LKITEKLSANEASFVCCESAHGPLLVLQEKSLSKIKKFLFRKFPAGWYRDFGEKFFYPKL